jgi:hypothetical protein
MYVTISVGALLACAAVARDARGTYHRNAQPARKAGRGRSCCCCVNVLWGAVPVAVPSYLSRCRQVSIFIAVQARGIPPASHSGGSRTERAARTSVAIVLVGWCADVVVETGKWWSVGVRKDRVRAVGQEEVF